MEVGGVGRFLILAGLLLVGLGALLTWGPRLPWLGRLPGDLVLGGPGWKLYLPITTCLLLSAVASLILWVLSRGR